MGVCMIIAPRSPGLLSPSELANPWWGGDGGSVFYLILPVSLGANLMLMGSLGNTPIAVVTVALPTARPGGDVWVVRSVSCEPHDVIKSVYP